MVEHRGVESITTWHHSQFADIASLVAAKQRQGLTVSLCVPSYNEEETIGHVISTLKTGLMKEFPLLDEIVVMDSGSTDRTREVALAAGASVFLAHEILPELETARGKGENIWKSVYVTRGDILCYVDGDVRNMHPRFVYGVLGPLLLHEQLHYVKAFYHRAHGQGEGGRPAGGGRVTEALVRPLFALFYPELSGFIQPLSGEYAARRSVMESMAMPVGYGVETAHLLDVLRNKGVQAFGQCDLHERVHRHQSTGALGNMSFAILQAFLRRAERDGRLSVSTPIEDVYRHFIAKDGEYLLTETRLPDVERPAMSDLPDYRKKFPHCAAAYGPCE